MQTTCAQSWAWLGAEADIKKLRRNDAYKQLLAHLSPLSERVSFAKLSYPLTPGPRFFRLKSGLQKMQYVNSPKFVFCFVWDHFNYLYLLPVGLHVQTFYEFCARN